MPRLSATQSQSNYVIGGGGASSSSGGDRGGSELPRFDRPALKQARSAYSSTSRPKSSNNMLIGGGAIGDTGRGFFGRNNQSSDALPLTSSSAVSMSPVPLGGGNLRSKMRAAVSGRDTGDALPDWSRATPSPANSPTNSFNNNHVNNNDPRNRANSESHSRRMPQHTMSASLPQHDRDYHTDEDSAAPARRSSDFALNHHDNSNDNNNAHQHQHQHHHSQQSSVGGSVTNDSQILRQRRPDYPQSPHGNSNGSVSVMTPGRSRHTTRASSGSGSSIPEDSPYRPQHHHGNSNRSSNSSSFRNSHWMLLHKLRNFCGNIRGWNIGHFLQITVCVLVTFMLYDSHHKANLIAQRLKEFKSEEAMVFLHLHRIEQQYIQLHESLLDFDPAQLQQQQQQDGGINHTPDLTDNSQIDKNKPHIDSALIQKQTQQLLQMEEELSHEVRTLQTRIQHSAVRSIVHEYGEGPVQVILEVVVDGKTSKISILLWHDTPHAAWTWLEQISQRLWDGAVINLENNRIMNLASMREETSAARLDFVERSQQRHEAWTVGLVESASVEGGGQGVGGLELFINLQDNTDFSKHDVCVGKVFDGFDVLHKMVDQSRALQQAGGQAITIRTARASHLTNRETKGLI